MRRREKKSRQSNKVTNYLPWPRNPWPLILRDVSQVVTSYSEDASENKPSRNPGNKKNQTGQNLPGISMKIWDLHSRDGINDDDWCQQYVGGELGLSLKS